MADHLDSTKLVPFKRRHDGYHLPGLAKEQEEQIVDDVDPDLRPEEQGFVRHYLAYADILLRNSPDPDKFVSEETRSTSNGDQSAEESHSEKKTRRDHAA